VTSLLDFSQKAARLQPGGRVRRSPSAGVVSRGGRTLTTKGRARPAEVIHRNVHRHFRRSQEHLFGQPEGRCRLWCTTEGLHLPNSLPTKIAGQSLGRNRSTRAVITAGFENEYASSGGPERTPMGLATRTVAEFDRVGRDAREEADVGHDAPEGYIHEARLCPPGQVTYRQETSRIQIAH